MKFNVGDVVRLAKVRGPRMLVISCIQAGAQVPTGNGLIQAPVNCYSVAWFDRNDVLQERAGLIEMFLELATGDEPSDIVRFPSFVRDAEHGPGTDKTS